MPPAEDTDRTAGDHQQRRQGFRRSHFLLSVSKSALCGSNGAALCGLDGVAGDARLSAEPGALMKSVELFL